ncbi:hypothetical protein IF1G_06718 [Cordyceps javanica]|uniref:Uncharacterized protein n=1 Tax=Cordyceps javanica TaxID=43265 RepID=A0A545UZ25_9HYPO|nr:hypothetical protein IF1G_06718 [Cordyceps javanica]
MSHCLTPWCARHVPHGNKRRKIMQLPGALSRIEAIVFLFRSPSAGNPRLTLRSEPNVISIRFFYRPSDNCLSRQSHSSGYLWRFNVIDKASRPSLHAPYYYQPVIPSGGISNLRSMRRIYEEPSHCSVLP